MLFFWCVLYLHRLPRASPIPSSLGFSLGQAGFLATSWTSALVFEHAVRTIHLSPLPKLQPRVGGCLCGLASPYPPTGPLLYAHVLAAHSLAINLTLRATGAGHYTHALLIRQATYKLVRFDPRRPPP